MYTAGQVIDRKEHVKFANWKNANGGNLISVSLGGGQYRLEEQIVPEKTTEELAQDKRAERDILLAQTDKYMLSDFPITDEERAQYKAYRQYLRDLPEQESFPNVEIMTFEKYVESITQGE